MSIYMGENNERSTILNTCKACSIMQEQLNVYPKFFHTAAGRKLFMSVMQQAELHLRITNIRVFLKIATDCNFFLKKSYFYLYKKPPTCLNKKK